MRAAAQFDRIGLRAPHGIRAAHAQHAHLIAVFLAEQRHGPGGNGIFGAHQTRRHRRVGEDLGVHFILDCRDILGGERRRVREVEAQPLGRNHRALLRHMRAKPAAQGLVQQVRRRMVRARRIPPGDVDRKLHSVAHLDRTRLDRALMRMQPAKRLGRVGHGDAQALGRADRAGIAHLAAAFGIERGLVGDHGDRFTGPRLGHFLAVLHQRDHHALADVGGIAGELGRALALGNVEPHFAVGGLAAALPRRARRRLLLRHRRFKPCAVHTHPARTQRVFGKVIGEAEGVIEPERRRTGQAVAFAQMAGFLVEQLETVRERAAELHFLAQQRLFHERLGAAQFGKRLAHLGHERAHQPVHQRLLRAEQVRMAHRAAHDPAQHIAAALVARQHAVRQQEAGRAQMVGDHAMACPALAFGLGAGQAFRGRDQRAERVGVIVVVLALQHRRHALDAHAGIDARARQVRAGAIGRLLELHEHQVPDLDEPVTILVRRSRGAAEDVVAVVVEDFGARPAGTGIAHRPEIVRGRNADDAVIRKACDLLPQAERLVVGVIDCDEQLVLGQAPLARQQGPGVGDRLFLEVIPEREIAEHLEERVVARGVAHVVEVVVLAAGAHALLRGRRPLGGPRLESGEHVLERDHARVGEHERRVVERHDLVPGGAEVVEEGPADFVGRSHAMPIRRGLGAEQARFAACRALVPIMKGSGGAVQPLSAVAVTSHAAAGKHTRPPTLRDWTSSSRPRSKAARA